MAVITAAALLVWAAVPPDTIAIGPGCAPKGTRAHISAMISGDHFWQAQADAIAEEQQRLIVQQNKGDADFNTINNIEAKMDRLSAREASGRDEEQREAFHEQRQKERLGRLTWLAKCADAVQDNMK